MTNNFMSASEVSQNTQTSMCQFFKK